MSIFDDKQTIADAVKPVMERQTEHFRKYFNWQPGMTLGDGTYIPPRPPQADSSWIVTPQGWQPPPTLDELVKILPVPLWRRVWSKIYCWYCGL